MPILFSAGDVQTSGGLPACSRDVSDSPVSGRNFEPTQQKWENCSKTELDVTEATGEKPSTRSISRVTSLTSSQAADGHPH